MLLRYSVSTALACVLMLAGDASGAPAPDVVGDDAGLWNGVWAPEPRGPRGPGGAGSRADGPERRQAKDRGDGALRLGGPPPRSSGGPGGDARFAVSEADAAKGLEPADMRIRMMMTDAGRAKFDEFDPLELPSANCQTAGLPGIAMIPELQEWNVGQDVVTIRHESYGLVRKVKLGAAPDMQAEPSVIGQTTGSMDAKTLTIDSTRLSAVWGGLGRNAPGSAQRTVRETYRLVDQDTIEGIIELTDPLYLRRSLRLPVTLKRQPEGTQIEEFPCDVEVARRHIAQN